VTSLPRWAIPIVGAVVVLFGVAVWLGWLRDPTVAKSDYVGTIDVSAQDARLYRPVPFDWAIDSKSGSIKGSDTAYVRIDSSGELPLICGWLRLDPSASLGAGKAGASIRATRWLSEARLKVGDIRVAALFIAPADKPPGDGLNAGCARLLQDKPSPNAPLSLEGHAVRE
jgi:hypothetical protein